MQLLTQALKKQLPPLYSQENEEDPMVYVKFFCPWNQWTWFGYEFDQEDTFFGYVRGDENELGTFSLSELENVRGPGGCTIERDHWFSPTRLSTIMKEDK